MPPTTPPRGHRHGRSPKKNIALAAWHAPLGGRAEEADLCRGQGFRRIAPSAPSRFEDRHVPGPAGPEGQEGVLSGFHWTRGCGATHRLRAVRGDAAQCLQTWGLQTWLVSRTRQMTNGTHARGKACLNTGNE